MIQPVQNARLNSADRTQVLLSEASKMYCDLLNRAFSSVSDRFEVVASACNGVDILALVQEHRPKVAIVSDSLEEGPQTGLRLIPEVRRASAETRILVAMDSMDRESVIEAFRLGADGVFCRNSPFEMLCKSVDALAQGQIWANSTELRYVMEEFTRVPKQRRVDPTVENRITKRETDVVRQAVEGMSNAKLPASWD
jgi:two-component system, NarL family, nitrate/nitrite response regulator NarL